MAWCLGLTWRMRTPQGRIPRRPPRTRKKTPEKTMSGKKKSRGRLPMKMPPKRKTTPEKTMSQGRMPVEMPPRTKTSRKTMPL
jgi:hypothetical protein